MGTGYGSRGMGLWLGPKSLDAMAQGSPMFAMAPPNRGESQIGPRTVLACLIRGTAFPASDRPRKAPRPVQLPYCTHHLGSGSVSKGLILAAQVATDNGWASIDQRIVNQARAS